MRITSQFSPVTITLQKQEEVRELYEMVYRSDPSRKILGGVSTSFHRQLRDALEREVKKCL